MTRTLCVLSAAACLFALAACPRPPVASRCAPNAEGQWRIVSYTTADVSAVDDAEARSHIGKTVLVDKTRVVFDGRICAVSNVSVKPDVDNADFPTAVDYGCKGKAIIPVFLVGRSCDEVLASLDGAAYALRRQ